ncbi:hypothetical protein V2J94_41670 [Streptomyces sp. DSM 41524]|uniref:Uncharacterized protein n=1 Tax=Streptomyces asiaticus subsp. ignotus TaxID=3098222 RepID=A0ABU7QA59_9ACTN|nr:hypothetical protein [Streptomyces sp. DSM 41524]
MTDTKALNSLADLICRAQKQGRRTPMGIAMAIDAAQRHMTPETAAELEQLRARVDEVERAYTFDTAELKKQVAELEAARDRATAHGAKLAACLVARTQELMAAEQRASELEQRETALRSLLPTEPRPERGLPNELAHETGWHGAMELVAEVLGESLPYVVPIDEEPVPFGLTERAEAELLPAVVTSAALAAAEKLRRSLPLSGGERS